MFVSKVKNVCFQGKSQCIASGYVCVYINRTLHALCALHLMKAFEIKTFCTHYMCTAVL